MLFLNENIWISLKISLKFVPKVPINNISSLVQIMAWCRPGDKPLSEPMMVSLLTHICVTRPQWVKISATGVWHGCQNNGNIDYCFSQRQHYRQRRPKQNQRLYVSASASGVSGCLSRLVSELHTEDFVLVFSTEVASSKFYFMTTEI